MEWGIGKGDTAMMKRARNDRLRLRKLRDESGRYDTGFGMLRDDTMMARANR